MRLLIHSRGQTLTIVALFLSIVGLTLLIGFTGVAIAFLQKQRVQNAVDAAALAAARTARPKVNFVVLAYDRNCEMDGKCIDSPPKVIEMQGWADELFPYKWLAEAGCDMNIHDVRAKKKGHRIVCEYGALSDSTWNINFDRAFHAAQEYLNLNFSGKIGAWSIERFAVENDAHPPRVMLTVRATLPNSVLSMITRRPAEIRVEAWAEPRATVVP